MVDASTFAQPAARPGEGSPVPAKSASGNRMLHGALFLLFFSGAGALAWRGWEFYTLGVGARVDHPDFRVLGPGSNLGHGYGIAGTLLILTNLLYLLRRRLPRLTLGSLRAWLDIHVFTGLFGGLLVLFHSAFQVRSTIAWVTMGSLIVVQITGIVGRYLYSLAPRTTGERLSQCLAPLDSVGPGMGQAVASRVGTIVLTPAPLRSSLLGAVLLLPSWRREALTRVAVLDQVVEQYARHWPADLALLAQPIAACRRAVRGDVWAHAAAALLKSWRAIHRLSALLLVFVVSLHIGVAWYYGFVWIFGAQS